VSGSTGLPGRRALIYFAPPERHLLIDGNRVWLGPGPRENHARPAIDPMQPSANTGESSLRMLPVPAICAHPCLTRRGAAETAAATFVCRRSILQSERSECLPRLVGIPAAHCTGGKFRLLARSRQPDVAMLPVKMRLASMRTSCLAALAVMIGVTASVVSTLPSSDPAWEAPTQFGRPPVTAVYAKDRPSQHRSEAVDQVGMLEASRVTPMHDAPRLAA
jgi:hypothetical protein